VDGVVGAMWKFLKIAQTQRKVASCVPYNRKR